LLKKGRRQKAEGRKKSATEGTELTEKNEHPISNTEQGMSKEKQL
jgi:hypothetical protein